MALLTDDEAQDALNAAVKAAVDGSATPVKILWPLVQTAPDPDATSPWARVSYRTASQDQNTLGFCSEIGKRRFETLMVLMVDVYFPMSDELGAKHAQDLARFVRDQFRAINLPGITLLHPRATELPSDGKWYRRQFVVDCQYDTVG